MFEHRRSRATAQSDPLFSQRNSGSVGITIILPLAVFGDIQLAFELFFILLLYVFSLATHDFSAFVSRILIVSLIFVIQLFDEREHGKPVYLLLAPIGWLLFYLTTIVEVNALLTSLWGILRKQELRWQKWQRKGVLD